MSLDGRVARETEIIAASPKSFDHAVQIGFERASRTLRGIISIKVDDWRCKVEDGTIVEYRVTLRVLFVLES